MINTENKKKDIHCPICNKYICTHDNKNITPCSHTLFIASDEEFQYLDKRTKSELKLSQGYDEKHGILGQSDSNFKILTSIDISHSLIMTNFGSIQGDGWVNDFFYGFCTEKDILEMGDYFLDFSTKYNPMERCNKPDLENILNNVIKHTIPSVLPLKKGNNILVINCHKKGANQKKINLNIKEIFKNNQVSTISVPNFKTPDELERFFNKEGIKNKNYEFVFFCSPYGYEIPDPIFNFLYLNKVSKNGIACFLMPTQNMAIDILLNEFKKPLSKNNKELHNMYLDSYLILPHNKVNSNELALMYFNKGIKSHECVTIIDNDGISLELQLQEINETLFCEKRNLSAKKQNFEKFEYNEYYTLKYNSDTVEKKQRFKTKKEAIKYAEEYKISSYMLYPSDDPSDEKREFWEGKYFIPRKFTGYENYKLIVAANKIIDSSPFENKNLNELITKIYYHGWGEECKNEIEKKNSLIFDFRVLENQGWMHFL